MHVNCSAIYGTGRYENTQNTITEHEIIITYIMDN